MPLQTSPSLQSCDFKHELVVLFCGQVTLSSSSSSNEHETQFIQLMNMSSRLKRCTNPACRRSARGWLTRSVNCPECGALLTETLAASMQAQSVDAAVPDLLRSRPSQSGPNQMSQTHQQPSDPPCRANSTRTSPQSSLSREPLRNRAAQTQTSIPLSPINKWKFRLTSGPVLSSYHSSYVEYWPKHEQAVFCFISGRDKFEEDYTSCKRYRTSTRNDKGEERQQAPSPKRFDWCFRCHSSGHWMNKCQKATQVCSHWTIGRLLDVEVDRSTETPYSADEFMSQIVHLSNMLWKIDSFVKARDTTQYSALTYIRREARRTSNRAMYACADTLCVLFAQANKHTETLRSTYSTAGRKAWASLMRSCEADARRFDDSLQIPEGWRTQPRQQQLVIFGKLVRNRQRLGLKQLKGKETHIVDFRETLKEAVRNYEASMVEIGKNSIASKASKMLKGTPLAKTPWLWLQPIVSKKDEFVPEILFHEERSLQCIVRRDIIFLV